MLYYYHIYAGLHKTFNESILRDVVTRDWFIKFNKLLLQPSIKVLKSVNNYFTYLFHQRLETTTNVRRR